MTAKRIGRPPVHDPDFIATSAIDRQQLRLAIEAAEHSGTHYPRRWLSRWGALRPSTSTELNREYHRNRAAIAALVPKIQVERERERKRA